MIIGFDAKRIVRNGTGLGNYGRTLVADLHQEAADIPLLLFAPDKGRDELRNQLHEDYTLQYIYPSQWWWRRCPNLWRQHGIVSELRRHGVTIYHGLTGELPVGLHKAGIHSVVTIHDLIFLRHPEYYHRIDVEIYRRKFIHAVKQADRIIAISERTRQDICELGNISANRIDVVYQSCARLFHNPGGETDRREQPQLNPGRLSATSPDSRAAVNPRRAVFPPGPPSLPYPFVLSVGSIEPRKNLLLTVKAMRQLPDDVHLVAVGRATDYARQVADYARSHQLSHRLHLLHDIDDQQLVSLYQQASVFAYPSRYEGFGIPIIEAIHSGLPVVAATGSCLEEAGGPDCLYVGPDDDDRMAAALAQLLKEGKNSQRTARATQYIQRFNNADVARQVLTIYHELN